METTILIDVAISVDSNIRKKEHKKVKKCQEQLEQMWRLKS